MLKFRGSESLRTRLALSCTSGRPISVDDIRSDAEAPGLCGFEASLLRLTEKISNGCVVEINETGGPALLYGARLTPVLGVVEYMISASVMCVGTSLKFRPGVLWGGSGLVHDCGSERAVTYFLEPLLVMCIFAKKPLDIVLKGVTNGPDDPGLDVFRAAVVPLFKHIGADVQIAVRQRAVGPVATGSVHVTMQNMSKGIESPVALTDEGLVKRVRGVAWTVNMGPQYATAAFSRAKGVFLQLLADVTIFTDVVSVKPLMDKPKPSVGYGIALIAETNTGCYLAAERCVSGPRLLQAKQLQQTPEDTGEQAACLLLDEIQRGGVVDGAQQPLLLLLAALGPREIHRIRLGALTRRAVAMLRHLKDFLGVQFDIKPDRESHTVFLSCIGYGAKNLSRRVD